MDELVETIFEQYEEYDGATLERVWQSLFKVYNRNHKLRKLGDNDFSVEHTGVSARQGAQTLERVLKYDKNAFTKAWDYLAKSPSDGEDDQQKQKKSNLKKKKSGTLLPLEKGQNTAILGPND